MPILKVDHSPGAPRRSCNCCCMAETIKARAALIPCGERNLIFSERRMQQDTAGAPLLCAALLVPQCFVNPGQRPIRDSWSAWLPGQFFRFSDGGSIKHQLRTQRGPKEEPKRTN